MWLRLLPFLLSLVLSATPLISAEDPADRQTPAVRIGEGASPDVAIDASRGRVHLLYRRSATLLYRTGDLEGRFGPPEVVFTSPSPPPSLWDPRLALDADGHPHVVFADGHLQNAYTWYTHRRDGTWREPLIVFSKEQDRLDRATMPHLVVEPDLSAVYVGAFTVGGPAKGEGDEWGILARIEEVGRTPRIVTKRRILAWNPQLALVGGELWVGGRNIRVPNRLFALQVFDKATLAPRGEPVPLSGGRHGEIARMAVDAQGDLHAAGTLNQAESAETAGWYNSLSRARAGKPALKYLTTNRNASGAGHPVPDARTPGRVYVVHWHGADEPEHQPRAGAAGNHLHYVRFENGEKRVEGRRISDRMAPHGNAYRHTPAATAHPRGGFIAIIEESGAESTLYFCTVGVPAESPRD